MDMDINQVQAADAKMGDDIANDVFEEVILLDNEEMCENVCNGLLGAAAMQEGEMANVVHFVHELSESEVGAEAVQTSRSWKPPASQLDVGQVEDTVGAEEVPDISGKPSALAAGLLHLTTAEKDVEVRVGTVQASAPGDILTLGRPNQGVQMGSMMVFTPSLALGPFLEKALMELKKNRNKKADKDKNDLTLALGMALGSVSVYRSSLTPLRRSLRRQGSIDEDSTERAAKLVAKKNLEKPAGNDFDNSILTFSDKHVADNIKNIGISMGIEVDSVQSSVALIKKVEKDIFKIPVIKTGEDSHEDIDLVHSDCDIDHATLGHLCGDLREEVMDKDNEDVFFTICSV